MTSLKCVAFKPREGVEKAITSYMDNMQFNGSSPQACRAIIRKEEFGFHFALVVSLNYAIYHANEFILFTDCNKQVRNWQVAVYGFVDSKNN